MFKCNCNKVFPLRFELMISFLNCFSLLWAQHLGAQTCISASKTCWISHWVAPLEIALPITLLLEADFLEGA